ncbi:MAG: hypothetical protein K5870_07700 [Lachnospiraceae bacterium]|nr:hypothetical protein [Lachnospiraceae bacterium]
MTDKKTFIKNIKIWDILPWIWLGAGILLMFIYHVGPGRALVDGDMAGEMILADLLNKEHDLLLSDNWYQATEIHVFFMQIIFRPLLLIWPDNWHTVRVVGMLLIYAINLIGYFFMMKQTGLRRPAVWSAGALMWPMGLWRLSLGLYGGQYLVYDFFTFYIIGLILYVANSFDLWAAGPENGSSAADIPAIRHTQKRPVSRIIAIVALAFLSFAGGVNGVRETMMLFMPLCLGIVIVIIRRFFAHKDITSWKEMIAREKKTAVLLLWIVFATICNLIGYAYNLLVLMKKYSFQKNTNMVWASSFSLNAIFDSISKYLGLFGYSGYRKLFSIEGLCSAAGILIAVILVFVVVRLFINRQKLSLTQEFILITFVSGLFACAIIFGLMDEMNEPRFWTPFMCFGIMLFEIEWDVEDIKVPNLKRVIAILISVCIVAASFGTIRGELKDPRVGKAKYLTMAHYLEENGYTQGYAGFWIANPITEFTANHVAVRPIMYQDSFEMMGWSNRIDYVTTYPDGEVFLLIDKKSYPGDVYEGYAVKYGNGRVALDDENWLLVTFDRAEDINAAYEQALANGDAISQAMRLELE